MCRHQTGKSATSGAGGSSGTFVVIDYLWSTELAQSMKETEEGFQTLFLMLCFGGQEVFDIFDGCIQVQDTIFRKEIL